MYRKIQYDTASMSGCTDADNQKILSFVIRSTDGKDELYASKRAEAKGTGMTQELMNFSVVSYTRESTAGLPEEITIKHPWDGFDSWSTKARTLLANAWQKLATPDEEDLVNFFKSATEIA